MKLHIADDLSLPLEAVTEKFAFLGRTGSGKSYAAQKLAEEMYLAKAQFVVLDPVGIWYGLRLAADGKSPGLEIPVFGGLRGDIPLEPNAGALIANLVVDRGASMILDVSQFESDTAKARFAHDFADRFFFRKKSSPSAVHLFVDEAQEFVPQNPQREEARMLHVFTRLLKLGRNFGIGASLLSQRPQEVNKKALNLAEVLFAFQLTGPQERKTVDGWIADKGIEDEDIAAELPKLKVGHPHVWSPAWLQISRVVSIAKRWTFDASSTPKVGKAQGSGELMPIDLEKLRTDMAATIERAKAEDPRELRKEIAELKKKLAARPTVVEEKIVEKIIEVPVLKNGQLQKTEKVIERTESLGQKLLDEGQRLVAESGELRRMIAPAFAAVAKPANTQRKPFVGSKPAPPPKKILDRTIRDVAGELADQGLEFHSSAGELKINKAQQRILDALAWYESLGNAQPTVIQVGAVALIDASGGYFSNLAGPLATAGFIERGSGTMRLTDAGREIAAPIEDPGSLSEYHDVLRARVRRMKSAGGKTIDMLDAIIAENGESLSTEQIGQAVGIDHTGGYFSNLIGPLSTVGLIERRGGMVTPTDVLFPPGLQQ